MILNRRYKVNNVLIVLIVLFLMQHAVSEYIHIFNYIDEVYALWGTVLIIYKGFFRRVKINKRAITYLVLFGVYSLSCLLGNFIYQYQPLNIVLIDFFTNFKFFGAIVTSLVLFRNVNYDIDKRCILKIVRVCSVFLFVLFLIDILFHTFPGEDYRYGFRSEQLIYVHPTYLAGVAAFVLGFLLIFFEKSNYKYMIITLFVLVSTLRGKAIVAAFVYMVILYVVEIRDKRFKIWHVISITTIGMVIAWSQIQFYYVELAGTSARSLLTLTSLRILNDYFPIGTGFGTFASHGAAVSYSPVYFKYGLNNYWELNSENPNAFFDDTFWPIIIGQSGVIGTVAYVYLLVKIFFINIKVRIFSKHMYASVLFVFAYLLISSTSESAFNNAVAIPFAVLLGYSWAFLNKSYISHLNMLNYRL